jgi:hypothetical protein
VTGGLEKWPWANVEPKPGEHEAWSTAVSLKRIADALTSGELPGGLHAQITHLAWEAGQNFGRGVEIGRGQ